MTGETGEAETRAGLCRQTVWSGPEITGERLRGEVTRAGLCNR